MTSLPGVHLQPGELRIEFNGTEDLLQRLYELSQAIVNDYQTFEEICKSLRLCAGIREEGHSTRPSWFSEKRRIQCW